MAPNDGAGGLKPTADPYVFIEEQRPVDAPAGKAEYIRYRRVSDGRRWEVHGTCDRRGDCLVGVVIEGEIVASKAHLGRLRKRLGRERIDSEMDVPVTPEFLSCCGADRFTYVELDPMG